MSYSESLQATRRSAHFQMQSIYRNPIIRAKTITVLVSLAHELVAAYLSRQS